ncbi:ABC transporter ATP-binding protein [Devosia nitrariae]|uniref:ABC transporter ATP-binding protein n=1 Tax=Devosia nitrariae TaxID=2071872 RepID=A0ABQ5W751_9HYPH|nr:sn-glycerol-3-phosphate ABC transporter ATP-binding protein UgpC [Devosia nitrariae]GLQ55604.1 ABC transporter ATP-binding protein [Devosia nitrariae]
MSALEVKGLRKSFGPVDVLHGIDIEITDGEFVALVGPSGCGKSTLLRTIAGLETVTGGAILIGGRKVNDVAPKNRDIAMVFQSYALYPHMTVAENMSFSLRLKRLPKAEIDGRLRRAAEILGLTELLQRLPKQLSGGQRQRVAMGRAIVRDPVVFLFDEPLSNLDAKLRVQMRAEIKELHQRLRTTTVYVTHDQVEAMTLADRIVVMHSGHIEQLGTPLELYDRPQTIFVAGFIGSPSMNLMDGTLRRAGGGSELMLPSGPVIGLPHLSVDADGVEVTFGIRPEHLSVSREGVPATVNIVEPTGAETLVNCRIGEQSVSVVVRDRQPINSGDTINLKFEGATVHLFDRTTGQRIG